MKTYGYRDLRNKARKFVQDRGFPPGLVVRATGISRASLYRREKCSRLIKPRKAHNALSKLEQSRVLEVLMSKEFIEDTPWQVVPILQDRGVWLCSVSTMYRLLRSNSQSMERRNQRRHPKHNLPKIEAKGPGEVWTWDITRLAGPHQGSHYFLYVMLDLFSRYVVGWMISPNENSETAQHFIRETVRLEKPSGSLIIHSDRGSPMKASNTVKLLAALGLSQSFARPRTSDDNPFSEAQFKTLKYHRLFKPWYESVEDARETLDKFFEWYNNDHMHSGLGFMTPATVHKGQVEEVKLRRLEALKLAYERTPERFPAGAVLPLPPEKVTINLPKDCRRVIRYLDGKTTLN